MNAILKSKSTRLLSALLAVLMIAAMLPTTAFAWSVEEGTKCTSTYRDKYLGSDGDYFYSKPTTTAIFYNDDGSFYVKTYSSGNAKYKYMMIDSSGNQHHVYCIEGGVSYDYSDTYNSTSGKNSKYFQNLPVTAQFGIMMALMYGYHEGMTTPVAGTNNDDFAFATQCIIWEYQQQLRTSPASIASNNGIDADMYNHTIKGRPAEKCYNWILKQMSKHYVVPSFSSRNQSNAQTYTMKYDQANDNYSITLTDTNNTLADINFSTSGITVIRSGNQYTFTSKNMISNAVTISAQKKTNLGMGKMLIWGCPGKQTMASGAEDPVYFYFKLNTETKGVGHIVKTSEDGKVEGIKFTITGNTIPCSGIGFHIYDPSGNQIQMAFTYPTVTTIDTFYTDGDGMLITPEKLEYGKGYSLVEVSAPYGYVLNSNPVYFDITEENSTEENAVTVVVVTKENAPQMGVITVEKAGEYLASVIDTKDRRRMEYRDGCFLCDCAEERR